MWEAFGFKAKRRGIRPLQTSDSVVFRIQTGQSVLTRQRVESEKSLKSDQSRSVLSGQTGQSVLTVWAGPGQPRQKGHFRLTDRSERARPSADIPVQIQSPVSLHDPVFPNSDP
jgi:hypothetical protein